MRSDEGDPARAGLLVLNASLYRGPSVTKRFNELLHCNGSLAVDILEVGLPIR
jgi:hypothetical protein